MDMIHQIATAAEQQSSTAAEVAKAVEEINTSVQANDEETHHIQDAFEGLKQMAHELTKTAAWFKV